MTDNKPRAALEPLPPLPAISPEELTPVVKLLLALLEQYRSANEQYRHLIATLEQRVAALEAEVRRLQKLPPRPNIKPSALDKNRDDDNPMPT